MIKAVQEAFQEMQSDWQQMQSSDMDSAGDDADRFQAAFYRFIDAVKEWLESLEQKPRTTAAALDLPELSALYDELPAPLLLNFETELELIVEGIVRVEDARYDD
ncbi:hypothetical protein [Tumebacillus lipolyticus]|uniref:Uncharacterized protein n=1 Tax=Tumebacillus lipolyticus TaxID=1280370 RepID=A0ABW4ZVV1_9BACL